MQNIKLIILIIILPTLLFAQQDYVTSIQHFSVEEGLSDRNVITTFQDSQGFIWFGTRYGLNRFDGHNFKIISKEKNGLENNIVHHIIEDDEGWLWAFQIVQRNKIPIITFINTKTLEVQNVQQRFGDKFPISLESLSEIIQGKNQSILLSGDGKIMEYHSGKFHEKYETNKYIKINDCTKSGKIIGIIEWQTNDIRYFEFDGTFKVYDVRRHDFNTTFFAIETKKKNYWIYELDYYLYQRTGNNQWEKIPFNTFLNNDRDVELNFLSNIYYQKKQDLHWYKDDKHFFLFRPYEGIVLDLNEKYPEIVKKSIRNIFFDNKDNAWVTTDFGVYKIRVTQNKFTNYLNRPIGQYDVRDAFSSRALFTQDTLLYVNNNFSKTHLLNLNTKEYKTLNSPILYQENGRPFERNPFQSNLKIGKDQSYYGYEHLVYYEKNQAKKIYTWKNVEKFPMIWWIHQDKQQKIWLGTHDQGIGIIDKDSLSLYPASNDFNLLNSSSVYHFLNWDNDNLLVASTSGLYVLNKKKGIVQRFWNNEAIATKIPHDIIHHIHRDKNDANRIWLATGGGGLISCVLSEDLMQIEEVQQYTVVDGLSNNVIYAVYDDVYNNLWIPSDYGIIQFNKETKSSKAFTIDDGLPFNEFNRVSHYERENGQLFFGTMNGVTSFYPKDILDIKNDLNIPLRITDFQQFNGSENKLENRTNEFIKSGKIVLNPSDKFFNLEFALLEYKDANQVKYSYQLEGQGDEWTYLNNNQLRISGLPYGNLTLKVRAQGTSGQFSSNILSIPIRVKRPFYLQWWFIVSTLLLAISGVYFWNKRRLQSVLERQEELEQTVKERTSKIEKQAEELRSLDAAKSRFFANVSHELRTPLTLILAPIENSLKRNRLENRDFTNLQMAKNNGRLLLKMVNEILDLSKLEAGKLKLNPTTTNCYQHYNTIIENFIPVANQKEINYQFNFDGDKLINAKLDKQKTQVILINLLSNAFKFTPNKGKISVDIRLNNDLKISVSDTGRGIASEDIEFVFDRFYQTKKKETAAEGGTGIGLALVQELTQLMGGNVEVKSTLGKGTTFTIDIPNIEIVDIAHNTEINNAAQKELFIHAQTNLQQKTNDIYLKSNKEEAIIYDDSVTILLVEDNPDLRQFIASLLSEKYQVITAENGAIGWEKLQTNKCDLILSDIMMPVMDGYQLLNKIKNSSKFQNLPIILLTAKASIDDKLKALRIGVDDYLTKPFIEEELMARVQNLLRNAAVRKETIEEIQAEKITIEPSKKVNKSTVEKEIVISKEQQIWLDTLEKAILTQIQRFDFTIEELAFSMQISKRQLHRNIKQYVGLTPNKYIRIIRLTEARRFLAIKEVNSVKAAAFSVGFRDVTYFSKLFKAEFGISPSEYTSN
ncbi:MAG: response regulator [Saprospiraceae bacterium]